MGIGKGRVGEDMSDDNVVKFPVKGGSERGPDIPDVIPLTAEMKAQLGIGGEGKVKGAVKVMSDGRRYEVTGSGAWKKIGDAPGTIEGRPWNERALAAEGLAKGLLMERERMMDRILSACARLREGGYEDVHNGKHVSDDPAFIEIEAWARGCPRDHGPLMSEMRPDGRRAVVKVEASQMVLECGHVVHMENHPGVKLTDVVECAICVGMLKERGWYKGAVTNKEGGKE